MCQLKLAFSTPGGETDHNVTSKSDSVGAFTRGACCRDCSVVVTVVVVVVIVAAAADCLLLLLLLFLSFSCF